MVDQNPGENREELEDEDLDDISDDSYASLDLDQNQLDDIVNEAELSKVFRSDGLYL